MRIVDVSAPPAQGTPDYLAQNWRPVEVANYYEALTIDEDRLGNIHYSEPYPELVYFPSDGKMHHITILAPEVLDSASGTGQLWILDTTDHNNIELLSNWEFEYRQNRTLHDTFARSPRPWLLPLHGLGLAGVLKLITKG